MAELMLSLALLGLLSALTIPGIIMGSVSNDALFRSKNMASELQEASEKYKNVNEGIAPAATKSIADLTKYVKKIDPAAAVNTNGLVGCILANPCYLYADGSALKADTMANPIATFQYDPDGPGQLSIVFIQMDVDTGRIAPRQAFSGVGADPSYIKEWTKQ